jgi:hypothetical protein
MRHTQIALDIRFGAARPRSMSIAVRVHLLLSTLIEQAHTGAGTELEHTRESPLRRGRPIPHIKSSGVLVIAQAPVDLQRVPLRPFRAGPSRR